MLSVVVPVLNEQLRISRCLRALLSQTDAIGEVIVVDNGSTDATASRVAEFPQVRLIHESLRGVGAAQARGFNAARGSLLARVDADTIVDPGWAAAVRRGFGARPAMAAAGGVTRQLDAPRLVEKASVASVSIYRRLHATSFNERILLYGHNMCVRTAAWRRVRDGLSLAEEVAEDVDLTLALLRDGADLAILADMTAAADLWRTLRASKLIRYARSDRRLRRVHLNGADKDRPRR